MTIPHFLVVAAAIAVAACVQGTIGIGFALIAAPVLAFLSPELLPVSLLFLMVPLNLFTVWRERHALDWRGGGWILLGRAVGTPAGVSVLAILSSGALNKLIGGAVIAAAMATLLAPVFAPNRTAFLTVGLLTGISETATGIGGPPLALAYQHHRPEVLRSTVAACFLLGEILSLASLGAAGRTTLQDANSAALLLPFLAIGGIASTFTRQRLNGRVLRVLVLLFAMASGAALFIRG
jgi:uncharacterized membrane protein YfcA